MHPGTLEKYSLDNARLTKLNAHPEKGKITNLFHYTSVHHCQGFFSITTVIVKSTK
jgi:hypothetical protein